MGWDAIHQHHQSKPYYTNVYPDPTEVKPPESRTPSPVPEESPHEVCAKYEMADLLTILSTIPHTETLQRFAIQNQIDHLRLQIEIEQDKRIFS